MELSKQIDYLSKEYLEKEKSTEQQLHQENENLQKCLILKIQEVEGLKIKLLDYERTKLEKQELEKSLSSVAQHNTTLESHLINQKKENGQLQLQKRELENENTINRRQIDKNEELIKEITRSLDNIKKTKETLEEEINVNLKVQLETKRMEIEQLSQEREKQSIIMNHQQMEIKVLTERLLDQEKESDAKCRSLQQEYEQMILKAVQSEKERSQMFADRYEEKHNREITAARNETESYLKSLQQKEQALNQCQLRNLENEQRLEELNQIQTELVDKHSENKSLSEQLRSCFSKIAELEIKKSQAESEKINIGKELQILKRRNQDIEEKSFQLMSENEKLSQLVQEQRRENETQKAHI